MGEDERRARPSETKIAEGLRAPIAYTTPGTTSGPTATASSNPRPGIRVLANAITAQLPIIATSRPTAEAIASECLMGDDQSGDCSIV